jgi:DNA-binding CsgD family transcriptional regulator
MTPSNPPDKTPNKIDVGKALKLRLVKGLAYEEIAKQLGCAKSTAYKCIHDILALVDNPKANRAFAENQVNIMQGAERVLLGYMLDPENLKRASVNNLAYAFQQIHNARRLESGLSTENVDVLARYEALQEQKRTKTEAVVKIRRRLIQLGHDPDA